MGYITERKSNENSVRYHFEDLNIPIGSTGYMYCHQYQKKHDSQIKMVKQFKERRALVQVGGMEKEGKIL